jgi:hypothetical protein
MRVVVDLNRCQSYGQCAFAARRCSGGTGRSPWSTPTPRTTRCGGRRSGRRRRVRCRRSAWAGRRRPESRARGLEHDRPQAADRAGAGGHRRRQRPGPARPPGRVRRRAAPRLRPAADRHRRPPDGSPPGLPSNVGGVSDASSARTVPVGRLRRGLRVSPWVAIFLTRPPTETGTRPADAIGFRYSDPGWVNRSTPMPNSAPASSSESARYWPEDRSQCSR